MAETYKAQGTPEPEAVTGITTPGTVTTVDQMRTQRPDANQFKQAFEQRQQASQGNIRNAFDSSLNRVQAGLQDSLRQNTAAQDAATAAGQRAFDVANNDLAVQAGRTQAGMDSYADVRGLNRQPGSQQSLSLGLAAQTAAGRLAQQQQMAAAESARQKALLSTDYNNRVQAAIADRDYKQAAALLDDYNNQNSWLDKNAELMAGLGNFAGYEQLYGPETAGMMQNFWIGSNPELAYNTGAIDAERYKAITGREAPGTVHISEGGGGGTDRHTPSAEEIYIGRGGGSGGGGGNWH
jgi:hypothetical protein